MAIPLPKTREDLLLNFFNVDVSGNEIDGHFDYYRRANPKMITKTKATEFDYIMDILLPTWREHDDTLFELRHVELREGQMCICTQEIADICVFVHPSIPKGLQIGNACVEKINLRLRKEAESAQRKLKKQRKEEQELKERDELVSKVEKEYDDHVEFVLQFEDLKRRATSLEAQLMMIDLFRPCIECNRLAILKDAPSYKTKCLTCYKK
jgi:hypothetical protein